METQLLFEIILAVIFVLFLTVFVAIKRKKMAIQKILFPFFYLILYRSNFGLKFMRKFAKKHRSLVQLFGYSCIGISIIGMFYISITMIYIIYKTIVTPAVDPGFALVLPFTNIPGVGYLYFSTWIVAIFILAVIHEFSHGIVAESHGLKVKSSGFVFFSLIAPIIPGAFVEPDEKKMSKRDASIQYSVFAAGPVINIIVAFIILLSMPYVADPYGTLAPFEDKITEPIGLSFESIPDYPANKTGMNNGIITSVNGIDVIDFNTFRDATYGLRPEEELNIETTKGDFDILTTESPENSRQGYIGIKFVANERRVLEKYQWIKHSFYWLKDFFRWFFLFNFAIGLFNLLPLGIVDGGRMFKIFLDSTVEKKKAGKIWGAISFFFLGLLLFGLIVTYIGNPFSLLFPA